jgi:Sec-independent protein translocase protein TatA
MSRHDEARYQIERQRRQDLFNQRVRETTRTYLARYRGILEDVQSQRLNEYVQAEFSELERELASLTRLVESDPAAARDRSIELGRLVHALPRHARGMRQAYVEAQRQAEEAAREDARRRVEQEAKARDELETAWQDALMRWADPLARQLAFKALSEARARLMGANSHTSIAELRTAIGTIKAEYEQRSRQIREKESKAAEANASADALQLCREQIASVGGGAAERAQALGSMLNSTSAMSPEEVSRRLVEVTRDLDAVVVDESCRREVVQAVYRALEDAGFVTEKPRLVRDGSANEVVIRGKRPAGAQAEFKVELSGKLNYKFDHYHGAACKKDIDTVLPRLQSIYGIQLSTERTLWENPDDKDSDAKPQPGMTREK